MEKDDPEMFETYQELICHFYICMDIYNTRRNANGIKVWADYLFLVLDGAPENIQFSIPDDDINQKMISSAHEDVVLEEMTRSMKRVAGLRAFIFKRNTLYLEKLSSLTSCQFARRNVSFHLLRMMKFYCECFFLLSSLLMANLLSCFLPWSAASNGIFGC